jgi:hypothetical protein
MHILFLNRCCKGTDISKSLLGWPHEIENLGLVKYFLSITFLTPMISSNSETPKFHTRLINHLRETSNALCSDFYVIV